MAEHNLSEFYTRIYTHGKGHDSPDQSRINMRRRIITLAEQAASAIKVLGIGAGRGEVEATSVRNAYGGGNQPWQECVRNSVFVTIDIAKIPRRKLVSPSTRTHVQGDSRRLPFTSGVFDIATSNLSIDMLRRNGDGDYE